MILMIAVNNCFIIIHLILMINNSNIVYYNVIITIIIKTTLMKLQILMETYHIRLMVLLRYAH